MNPYLFVAGSQRSGTMPLRRMVDSHPRLAIIHETEWFEKRFGMTSKGYGPVLALGAEILLTIQKLRSRPLWKI